MLLNIIFFVGCLVLVLYASDLLAQGLDRVGRKFHLSDELLGVVTALGADAPEISSAIVALVSHRRDLGVGIVLGSNLFNLAALLGLGALVAGQVAAPSAGTLFNGAVALGVTVLSGALIAGFLNPLLATFLVLLIVALNIYILAVSATHLERLSIPSSWKVFLIRASREAKQETREIGEETNKSQREKHPASIVQSKNSWKPALLIGAALVAIVLGSIGLIKYATAIGQGWLPEAVLGTFVLASLTGLPNSMTAVRLAQSGKGSAVIAETFNSNTINIVVGLLFPALIFGQSSPDSLAILDVSFLIVMTLLSVVLSAHSEKLTRTQGILLIAFYVGFVGAWTILFMNTAVRDHCCPN